MRLITRNGSDFTDRFPYMAAALKLLPVRSCIIDGEAIVCDENGLAVFELIRGRGSKMSAVLCAFDLLELDGRDLRRRPIGAKRPASKTAPRFRLRFGHRTHKHYEEDGAIVFRQACQLGCDRINLLPRALASLAESQKSVCASG
jgi:bifunctional non-homologous end joining protein LigD